MKLYDKVNEIQHEALTIIRNAVKKHEGRILFATEEDAMYLEADELQPDFVNNSVELIHSTETEGNTVCYPMLIVGDKNDCKVQVIDEQCNVFNIDLFDMDIYTLALLADYVESKEQ